MDESGVSGYTYGVIRLRFLAVVLAFVVPVLGWFPASANEPLWVGSDTAKVRAEALLKALRGAADHGLTSCFTPTSARRTATPRPSQTSGMREASLAPR